MNYQVRLIIHKKKSVYDDLIVSSTFTCKYKSINTSEENKHQEKNTACVCAQQPRKFFPIPLRKKGFNAYLISVYVYTMDHSVIYRKSAVTTLVRIIETKSDKLDTMSPVILIKLKTPRRQFIDYSWNERLTQMAKEREEIDQAMSWLSTLGGAFSALGDQFDYCAKVAGKISVEQFKLSIRLGNPQLLARCELYAALSLLQQGNLRAARRMVKKIFKFAVSDKDIRLQKMCQGVWAKLKYCYSQRKQKIR